MSRILMVGVLAGAGILLPYFAPDLTGAVSVVLLFVMLATGLNLELGLARLPDFAFVGYCAIGAWCDALLTRAFGLSFWVCLPAAGALAAVTALLIASPLLRLKREVFATVTLGFAALMQIALIRGTAVAGGVSLDFPAANAGGLHYYVVFAALMITGALSWRMRSSPFGLALRAAREDELACLGIGLDPRSCKRIVVAFAALIAGIAGCLLVAGQGSMRPGDFDFGMTASLFAIVILGAGRMLGIIFSAIIIVGVPQLFPALSEFRLLVCGIGLMLWAVARAVSLSRSARRDDEGWNFATIIETPAE